MILPLYVCHKPTTNSTSSAAAALLLLLLNYVIKVSLSLFLAIDSAPTGHRDFSIVGSMVWNLLPDELRDLAHSFDSFRQFRKTVLFSLY